jgi:hypothetical protein
MFLAGNETRYGIYRKMSLIELVGQIVAVGDRDALAELHDNRLLSTPAEEVPYRIVEYIEMLKTQTLDGTRRRRNLSDILVEDAYSLTVDKFSLLPCATNFSTNSDCRRPGKRRQGTNCRYYFHAFLKRMARFTARWRECGSIQIELLARQHLKAFIRKHFNLSLQESKRLSNPCVNRYAWHVNGSHIYVWFPRSFDGAQRQSWLETHVDDPDPYRPGEQLRVQRIVDECLPKSSFVALEESMSEDNCSVHADLFLPWAYLYGLSVEGLASVVGKEKADHIDRLRPGIRQLGPERLKELIRRIFDALVTEDQSATKLSREFGISKASLSRFAGAKWNEGCTGGADRHIPVLWANVAGVLAGHPSYREAAIAVGVWPQVKTVVERTTQGKPEEVIR